MSKRRKQHRRASARATLSALAITALVFGVVYLLQYASIQSTLYDRVLQSGGRISYLSAVLSFVGAYIPHTVVVYVAVYVAAYVYLRTWAARQRRAAASSFTFDAPGTVPSDDHIRLSPSEFEERVAWLIEQQTGYDAEPVGGAGDGGVDVKVYDQSRRLVGVVQCKRYQPGKALAPMFVREMLAVKEKHGVPNAYLATTAYFSDASKDEAARLGIRLIDGEDLKRIEKELAQN